MKRVQKHFGNLFQDKCKEVTENVTTKANPE